MARKIMKSIKFDRTIEQRLRHIADEEHLPFSEIVRMACRKLVEERANGRKG